jgi:LysR family transcriptional regulator, benzoate and cis,cis-muconate-responsive activator of ben and cat genes
MELRHLRYFLAVAEELSFTRAAKRLCIAQPPLSQQIRQLETEFSVRLFQRASRPLQVTEAGALLAKRARVILEAVEKTRQEMLRMGAPSTGRLSVAFAGPALDSILPGMLSKFRKRSPHIDLSFHEMWARDMASALQSGQIDIGFSQPPLPEMEGLNQRSLMIEPYLAAVSADHPFACRESIAFAELNGEPLILYTHYSQPSVTALFLKACASAGFEAQIAQEVNHTQTALGLVASGAGVTFVTKSASKHSRSDVHFLPLQPPAPAAELAIAWRREAHSLVLGEFLTLMEEERGHRLSPIADS